MDTSVSRSSALRPDSQIGLGLYAGAIALACALSRRATDADANWLVTLGRVALYLVVVGGTSGLLLDFVPERLRRWVLALVGALWLVAHLGAVYLIAIWGAPPQPVEVWAGIEAISAGDTPVTFQQAVVPVAALVGFTLVSGWVLSLLTRLPSLPTLERVLPLGFRTLGATVVLLLWFRDYAFPPGSIPRRIVSIGQGLSEGSAKARGQEIELKDYFRLQTDLLEKAARAASLAPQTRLSPSLLFVHIESLRADYFKPEFFPKTLAKAKRCFKSPRHYSSGNGTSNAVVGILNGLSPGYIEFVRRRGLSPQPLRALRELGYETHVWFPNDTMVFDDLLDGVFGPQMVVHQKRGTARDELDRSLVDDIIGEPRDTGPRFDYLVLDSTHYDYAYPAEFERHVPTTRLAYSFNPLTGEGSLERGAVPEAMRQGLINRYKNSTTFVDSLLERLLDRFVVPTSAGPNDSPWLVIFGDHGEALGGEDGTFGHSTRLTDDQVRVPLIMCGIEQLNLDVPLTAHEDIFATVFDAMGVRTRLPFMSGKSLLGRSEPRGVALVRMPVTSHWASRAYRAVTPGRSVSFQILDDSISTVSAQEGDEALVVQALGEAELTEPHAN